MSLTVKKFLFLFLFSVVFLVACTESVNITINFESNGGSFVSAIKTDGSSSITIPLDPEKEGYSFGGWYWDNNTFNDPFTANSLLNRPVSSNLTVYAKWIIDQYTITFESNGGSPIDSITQDYATIVSETEEPERVGYTFVGWSPVVPNSMPAENLTLVAQWQINEYTISFDSNEGSSVDAITQEFDSLVIKPTDPTKEGYTFDGWYSDEELLTAYTLTTIPSENLTIYAKWTINSYTLQYIDIDGTVLYSNDFDYHSDLTNIEVPLPSKIGYTFIGWDSVLPDIMSANHLTIQALYEVNQYIISFESNGGSLVDEIIQDYDTLVFEPIEPTKEDYVFDGWYSDVDYLIAYQFTTMPSHDMMLYAKWEAKSYTISYYLEGSFNLGDIVAGVYNTFYLGSDGLLYGTGRNDYWALGVGNIGNQSDFLEITPFLNLDSGEKILGIANSWYHSIAFTSNGRVFTWGYNWDGQLGNSTSQSSSVPIEITDSFAYDVGEHVIQVQAGVNFTIVLTNHGRVFSFGNNNLGGLGDGTTRSKSTPVEISANFQLEVNEIIVQIVSKGYHVLALSSNGRLFGFGKNDFGSLGNGTTNNASLPIDLTSYLNLLIDETIIKIEAGFGYSIVLTSTGRVLATGDNGQGIIGDGTQNHTSVFKDVTQYFTLNQNEIIEDIVSLNTISIVLTSQNRVFAYGSGTNHLYGSISYLPVEITDKLNLLQDEKVVTIYTGAVHSFVVTNLNRIIGFGRSNYGQLGMGEFYYSNSPMEIEVPTINVEVVKVSVQFGDTIELLNPEKTDYTFDGWYLDEALTIIFDSVTMPSNDLSLYAKWIVTE